MTFSGPTILLAIAAIFLFLHYVDGRLKANDRRNVGYLIFLQKNGLDIGLFRVSWYTAKFNRLFLRIGAWSPRLWSLWFSAGAVVSSLVVVPSMVFLVRTLCLNLIPSTAATSATDIGGASEGQRVESNRIVLQPVVPGVNMPMSDLAYYVASLLGCSIFHEFGHAVAAVAEDLKPTGFGFFILFVLPAAFVDLPTDQLLALRKWGQLKIFSAGIWNNIVLTALAYLVLLSTPILVAPFFHNGTRGVFVSYVNPESALTGPTGLKFGHVITDVNGCRVKSVGDFKECIVRTIRDENDGVCVLKTTFDKGREDILEADSKECCGLSVSSLCFKDENDRQRKSCLRVRPLLEEVGEESPCNVSAPCKNGEERICVTPSLANNQTRLVSMKRRDSYQAEDSHTKDFLFVGYPAEAYRNMEITDYVPKFRLSVFTSVFGRFPGHLAKLAYYTASFSGALALLNVVPCFLLDGQHMTRVLVDALFGCYDRNVRSIITLSFTIVGTVLLILNLLVGIWKIF